jgi:hypothetical protein
MDKQEQSNKEDLEYLESLHEKEVEFKEENDKKIRACW